MTTNHLAEAARFAPIVERVHGANHPELTRVRELTEALQKAGDSAGDKASVSSLFAELRAVTNNYELPADACEAFTTTYTSLRRADQAHAS